MNIGLLLSGGTGTRLGGEIPKQYIEVSGRPVIAWSLERLFRHEGIEAVQIVADPMWQEAVRRWIPAEHLEKKFMGFSLPGENRQLSILHGLEDIRRYAEDTDYVLVHDAARPMLTETLVSACLRAAAGHDGVMPVLPMKDTIYASLDGKTVSSLLNRRQLFAGQAPEVFQLGKYYAANMLLPQDKILLVCGASEPAVLAGMDIRLIPGDEGNFKITTQTDLARFQEIAGRYRK